MENKQGELPAAGSCCGCSRVKRREPEELKSLLNRLSRIEGQIRGIRGMLESSAYCTDVLVQCTAVNAALQAFERELLSNHLHTCVVDRIREGDDAVVDELADTLRKLMK